MSHVYALKTLFPSPADDWIVIAKQHCVGAPKELQNERLEKGLDPPQWMQIVKVNLLENETSRATRVSIAGRKQAIDLDISAVPPSEAADNFLRHLHLPVARPPARTPAQTRHAPPSRLTPRSPQAREADPGRRPCRRPHPRGGATGGRCSRTARTANPTETRGAHGGRGGSAGTPTTDSNTKTSGGP